MKISSLLITLSSPVHLIAIVAQVVAVLSRPVLLALNVVVLGVCMRGR